MKDAYWIEKKNGQGFEIIYLIYPPAILNFVKNYRELSSVEPVALKTKRAIRDLIIFIKSEKFTKEKAIKRAERSNVFKKKDLEKIQRALQYNETYFIVRSLSYTYQTYTSGHLTKKEIGEIEWLCDTPESSPHIIMLKVVKPFIFSFKSEEALQKWIWFEEENPDLNPPLDIHYDSYLKGDSYLRHKSSVIYEVSQLFTYNRLPNDRVKTARGAGKVEEYQKIRKSVERAYDQLYDIFSNRKLRT